MVGLLDPQPYGLLGDIRQYTGLPSRAIGGLLDWYQSQPSVADRMASEYRGGQEAMNAAGEDGLARIKALAAYQRSIPVADSVAMDLGGMLGSIKAYHGSPHNFDRFDMSKIGTGEGAQAYGHGLYFAENEGVARAYRDALSPYTVKLDNQIVRPSPGSVEELAQQYLDDAIRLKSSDPMSSAISRMMQAKQNAKNADRFVAAEQALRDWDAMGAKPVPAGRMYEVNINAKPEDFLDWDKPLTEQGRAVRSVIAPYAEKTWGENSLPWVKGSEVYQDLSSAGKYKESLSQSLSQKGIPGIKYLDQNSRMAGDGSRNYVVFDDSLIQILRKYGLLPPAIAGAGLLASPEDALAAP